MNSSSVNPDEYLVGAPPDRLMRALSLGEVDPLVEPTTWSRLLALTTHFPIHVQTLCFECRLAKQDPRVDLAFCLMPGPAVQQFSGVARVFGRADPAWLRCADFLDAWSSFDSPWAARVPFVCPAFDLLGDLEELPPPCLSACVDADFYAKRLGLRPTPAAASTQDLLALAEDCYARLTASAISVATRTRLRDCLDTRLNVEAKHMSWMLSRPNSPMKLDVRLCARDLTEFLRCISWPAHVDELAKRVREFVHTDDYIQLNLQLHPGLVPPLEVELFAGANTASVARRLELLDRLVATGLASSDKAAVLRAASLRPKCADEAGRVVAKSWYVKLRFGEHEACDAKAYFGLIPRLFRP